MSLCLMNVHGDIEGDYEFVCDIPNGTNGEVIQAVFPYVKTEDTSFSTMIGTNLDESYIPFQRDWWNAPYQKGGEE